MGNGASETHSFLPHSDPQKMRGKSSAWWKRGNLAIFRHRANLASHGYQLLDLSLDVAVSGIPGLTFPKW